MENQEKFAQKTKKFEISTVFTTKEHGEKQTYFTADQR
jgi:hypothetical protein